MGDQQYVVCFVTASSVDEAQRISKSLLIAKMAACVNLVKDCSSFFWWDKKIDNAKEVLMIIKTKFSLLEALTDKVKEEHSSDVPEIIALPIIGGNEQYLVWINSSLQ